MSVGEGASAHSSSVKTANNKIPVSSVFNDSERLYRTTQSPVALSVGLIVPRGYMSFGSRGPSEFLSQIRHRKALNEIAWEDTFNTRTRHGNVYRGVRDKQTIVVYRQCVLQTVTYLCVLFH